MKWAKPGLASNSCIFPRGLPRTEKFSDSDPRFEDPDIFYQNDLALIGFKPPADSEVFLNFETLSRQEFHSTPVGWILNQMVLTSPSHDNDLPLYQLIEYRCKTEGKQENTDCHFIGLESPARAEAEWTGPDGVRPDQ